MSLLTIWPSEPWPQAVVLSVAIICVAVLIGTWMDTR